MSRVSDPSLAYHENFFVLAVCCIYHKPKPFDESSDEESSDTDCDAEHDHNHDGNVHQHNHPSNGAPSQRPPGHGAEVHELGDSPEFNAYEIAPNSKGKGKGKDKN